MRLYVGGTLSSTEAVATRPTRGYLYNAIASSVFVCASQSRVRGFVLLSLFKSVPVTEW
jgi:hypothetical protein